MQVENEEGEEVCEYYMKWRNLPYSEVNSHFSKPIVSTLAPKATWEAESRVKEHFAESLKEFKTRKKSGNDPADYKQVKINDKKWNNSCLLFKPLF